MLKFIFILILLSIFYVVKHSEKEGNLHQNISIARQESGHEKTICCREHLNVDVLKNKKLH